MSKALTVLAACVDIRSGKRFAAGDEFNPVPTVEQARRLVAAKCLPEEAISAAAAAETEAEKSAAKKAKAEADAKAKAEADAKAKAEADAKEKAEADAKAKAEDDAKKTGGSQA